MSNNEFDNYLALLSRLLRLGSKQRDAIAGELRSHLEDRLDDLLARGVPRHEAVQQALEEFGDAAVLAAEIGFLARNRRRRWLMKLSTASAAAVVLIAAGIFTFWPGNNAGPGKAQVVAQNPGGPATATEAAPLTSVRQKLDNKLNQPFESAFVNIPLKDALHFIQEKTGIQFVVMTQKLEEAGVNTDIPVTISLKNVRVRTLLELILEPLELTFMTKDDLILITTPEDAESPDRMVIRVYDCRELLALPRPPGSVRTKVARGGLGGGGMFAVQDVPEKITAGRGDAGAFAPAGGGAPPAAAQGSAGGAGAGDALQLEISDAENLMDVIETSVDPETWVDVGGPCSIAEYKGLLSIAATQEVHEKVERLLNMFHQAACLREQKVKVVE